MLRINYLRRESKRISSSQNFLFYIPVLPFQTMQRWCWYIR